MLNDIYKLKTSDRLQTFKFISEGPKGAIVKTVEYAETKVRGIYNTGFGDKNGKTGYIDDVVVTNNQDSKKVLTTVAYTLYLFNQRIS